VNFHVLLDAPESPNARLQIATLGEFVDGRYGEFSITREDVECWQQNLEKLPGGRALIDLDHKADRSPRSTEAAGWITSIGFEGETPVAGVEWTPVGSQAIRDKRYLFFSPTYGEFKDEHGTIHENTLVGGALTNKPFLTGMPTLTLASEERLDSLQGEPPAEPTDSRAQMNPELLKALDLDETADEQKVLDAITALKAEKPADEKPEPTKTLEQLATENGKAVIDGPVFIQLQQDAAAGREARDQLHEQKFAGAFETAQRELRATPAQEEDFRALYASNPDLALKMLGSAPQILNAKPLGSSYSENGVEIPAGVHPESHLLDQKVKAKLKELGRGMDFYPQAYDLVAQEVSAE